MQKFESSWLWLTLAAMVAGCGGIGVGERSCTQDDSCPSGEVCNPTTRVCEFRRDAGFDANRDAGQGTDAPRPLVDAGNAPDTQLIGTPDLVTSNSTAVFVATSTAANATFVCQLDGAAFMPCPATSSFQVAHGTHTFAVASIANGTTDPTPATYTWRVDTMAPDTTITLHPDDPSTTGNATFGFVSTETSSTFVCRLDGGVEQPCQSGINFPNLGLGTHTFTVAAVDAMGNRDPSPASFTWHVTDPETAVVCPAIAIKETSTTITFSSNSGASFSCSLDGAPFAPCSSPLLLTGLAEGNHTFSVKSDASTRTPVPCIWSVDMHAPTVVWEPGTPAANGCTDNGLPMSASDGEVSFTSSDAHASGLTLDCTLFKDDQSYAPAANTTCQPGAGVTAYTYSFHGLPTGNYKLVVKATDRAGNSASSSVSWLVDATAPSLMLLNPSLLNNILSVPTDIGTFLVSGVDPTGQLRCVLDGQTAGPCSLALPYYNLGAFVETGTPHHIRVTASDCVGNTNSTETDFAVDVNGPTGDVTVTDATKDTGRVSLAFDFTDNVSNIETIRCALDDRNGASATLGTCGTAVPLAGLPTTGKHYTGTAVYSQLAPGTHRLWFEATDRWGHVSTRKFIDFVVSYSHGHVVVLGHDFDNSSVEQPDTSNGSLQRLIGNAAHLAPAVALTGFNRQLQVLGLHMSTNSAEADNVDRSLRVRLAELSGAVVPHVTRFGQGTVAEPGDFTQLAEYLRGQDVLVIYDINEEDDAREIGANSTINDTIRSFAEQGGIVILTDGTTDGSLSRSYHALGSDGVPNLADIADVDPVNDGTLFERSCNSTNPIGLGVGDTYQVAAAESRSVRFVVSEPTHASEVFAAVAEGTYGATVLDRVFPSDMLFGPIRVTNYRRQAGGGSYGQDLALRDGSGLVVFSDTNGGVVSTCPLRFDGSIQKDVPAGVTVSVLRQDLATFDTCQSEGTAHGPAPVTIAAVPLFSNLVVGRQDPYDIVSTGLISITGMFPQPAGAPTKYRLSTGCYSETIAPNFFLVWHNVRVDQRCWNDPDAALPTFNFVVEALNDDDQVLGHYAKFDLPANNQPPGQPMHFSYGLEETPGWVSVIDSTAFGLSVPAVPGSVVEQKFAQLGIEGILFTESEQTPLFYAPKPGITFYDKVDHIRYGYTNSYGDAPVGATSSTTTVLQRGHDQIPTTNGTVTLSAAPLAHVTGLAASSASGVTSVNWQLAAAPGSTEGAVLTVPVHSTATSSTAWCGPDTYDGNWTVVVPLDGAATAGSVKLPNLAGIPGGDCFQSTLPANQLGRIGMTVIQSNGEAGGATLRTDPYDYLERIGANVAHVQESIDVDVRVLGPDGQDVTIRAATYLSQDTCQ